MGKNETKALTFNACIATLISLFQSTRLFCRNIKSNLKKKKRFLKIISHYPTPSILEMQQTTF
jgi:hypothetical protein